MFFEWRKVLLNLDEKVKSVPKIEFEDKEHLETEGMFDNYRITITS